MRADTAPDVEDTLAEAQRAWSRGEIGRAIELFDSVKQRAPESTAAPWAAYWAACAAEDAKLWRVAAERFAALPTEYPKHELSRIGALAAVRILTFTERTLQARDIALQWLGKGASLSGQERVALYGAIGLGALERKDEDEASRYVQLGRRTADQFKLTEADVWTRDLAQLYFAQGELRRLQAERMSFVPAPADFAAYFEERAQTVLDAQGVYLDVMRARDAYWTGRAGLRIGELYQRLYSDVMSTPIPERVPLERRELFLGAMRARYVVLLEKGLGVLDRTLAMATRTAESNPWVEQVRNRRRELATTLDAENAALDALPVSRADLQRVLAEIGSQQ